MNKHSLNEIVSIYFNFLLSLYELKLYLFLLAGSLPADQEQAYSLTNTRFLIFWDDEVVSFFTRQIVVVVVVVIVVSFIKNIIHYSCKTELHTV